MQKLSVVDIIALVVLVIGGLNWGIIGLWPEMNVVDMIFGMSIARIIYVVVGVAALYVAWLWMKLERK